MSHQELPSAITIQSVSKDFVLPHEKVDSLKSAFVNPFRKRGNAEVQHALKNISFDIKQGEFFGIVGRNGSGKSTLLKIIAGIYQPTRGTIKVHGRLVPFIELGVGFNPELTGRENVYLNGALMGFGSKEVDAKYDAIVEFAELERFMDQKLKNYSSGMQVRLAFSVATILADSDVLLIDEVLAVGDADFQRKCFEYFKKLKKDKKTVIFVSHDMSAVREYCDKAVLIDNSEIISVGSSDHVAKEYTRLFMPDVYEAEERATQQEKYDKDKKANAGKWGAGGVDITHLKTDKDLYTEADNQIAISYKIVTKPGFNDEIVPGVVIKNSAGDPICGTNSQVIEYKKIDSGDTAEHTYTWLIPNVFGAGVYTIEPAILSASNKDTLQWWDDAMTIRVLNEHSTPYPVSPVITLSVK